MLTSPCSMFKDFATGLMVVTYSPKKAMSAGLYLIETEENKQTHISTKCIQNHCAMMDIYLFVYVPTADNVVSITLTK